jgi:hypothetical protein
VTTNPDVEPAYLTLHHLCSGKPTTGPKPQGLANDSSAEEADHRRACHPDQQDLLNFLQATGTKGGPKAYSSQRLGQLEEDSRALSQKATL